MEITIGPFNPGTRTVPVIFGHGDVTHARDVNAVLTEAGAYDVDATAERIDDVARGVEYKIEIGAIINPPPPPEPAD